MQLNLNLNQDLAAWIEAHKGDSSRAKFVVMVLRRYMQETNLMEDYNNETKITLGDSKSPVRI